MYTVAGIGMLIGLGVMGVSTPTQLGLSVLMLIPTGIGMWLGRFVRVQLSESRFEFVLICVYVATRLELSRPRLVLIRKLLLTIDHKPVAGIQAKVATAVKSVPVYVETPRQL